MSSRLSSHSNATNDGRYGSNNSMSRSKRYVMVGMLAVVVTLIIMILKVFLRENSILPGRQNTHISNLQLDSAKASGHGKQRSSSSSTHKKPSNTTVRQRTFHEGDEADFVNEPLSIIENKFMNSEVPLFFDEVWPNFASAFTVMQSLGSPERGWPADSRTALNDDMQSDFKSCMNGCSMNTNCMAFSYKAEIRKSFSDRLQKLIGAERAPKCLHFSYRSCWRSDIGKLDRERNPAVDSSVYEKHATNAPLPETRALYDIFPNTLLQSSDHATLITKRNFVRGLSSLQSSTTATAEQRAGRQCAELCRRHTFKNHLPCISFQVLTRVKYSDAEARAASVLSDLVEHLTCELRSDSLRSVPGAQATLVADSRRLDEVKGKDIALSFAGEMLHKRGRQTRVERICYSTTPNTPEQFKLN